MTYHVTTHIPSDSLPKTASTFLWHFVKRHGKALGAITFLLMFWSANNALYPYFVKMFIDAIVGFKGHSSNLWDVLKVPFWTLVIAFTVMEVATRAMGVLWVHTLPIFRADIRMQVVQYVKGHSSSYFTNNFVGTIAARIHTIPDKAYALVDTILHGVFSIILSFIFSCIVLSLVSPVFTGLMIMWGSIHLGISFYFIPDFLKKSKNYADAVSKMQGDTVDCVTNMTVVRSFTRGQQEMDLLRRSQDVEISAAISVEWLHEKVNILSGLAGLTFIITMIFFLIKGYQEQWVTVGDFPLVALTIFHLLGLMWRLGIDIRSLFKSFGAIGAALPLIRTPHEIVDSEDALHLAVSNGKIEVKNLGFSYGKTTPLFKNLNLTINPGESVGLVGFSGSGKTTFVNLLLRFFDIQQGSIEIDGQNIAKVTQKSLRANIAIIPQDPSLFHRTLRENICYGREGASDEEVIAASKMAHCHAFIKELEKGYDSLVGERGLKLSGGQRQRITIARAILKNAPILILDEATSALDSITEKYIQQSLQGVMKGRTTIVVAHRLSTLSAVDRIIVFDQGRIVEQGSQDELLKNKKGPFSTLWHLQNEGFLPDKRI